MTSITLTVTGAKALASVSGPLTSGMVGIPVTIQYDDTWNGLTKNLVCRCGQRGPDRGETRTVLGIEQTATVAPEVMQADMYLYLGIEGYSTDGKLIIPTTWAYCGKIQCGADGGADPSADPELPVWAQLQAEIEQIKQNLVTEEQIAAAVAAYLEENPIDGSDSSQNTDGLSDTAKTLLISILRNGVYSADQSGNITALAAELGVTEEAEHSHSYTSEVTTAATCTTAGVRTYTCSCGDSYTESIPATGHNYIEGVCSVCGAADPSYSGDVTLTSISATYSGGNVPVGTAVTDLTGIVVTAHYSDGSSETVTGYTLSGTIAEGENIITVTYEGMTATFVVTGVAEAEKFVYDVNNWQTGHYLNTEGVITECAADGEHGVHGQMYCDIPVTEGQTVTVDGSANQALGMLRIRNNTSGKLFVDTVALNAASNYKQAAQIPSGCQSITVSVYQTAIYSWTVKDIMISVL